MKRLFQTTFDQVRMPEERAQALRARLASPEQEEIKVKKSRFAVRTALAAAVIGALCCAGVGAARLALKQAEVFFFPTEAALVDAARKDGGPVSVNYYGGSDYDELQTVAELTARTWEALPGETLTEERTGQAGDGWKAARTFRSEEYDRTVWLGDKLSDLTGCWEGDGWDVSWLEEHYAPQPDAQSFTAETGTGREPYRQVGAVGEYRGPGGQVFNLQYRYDSRTDWKDRYELSEGYEVAQLYETGDGVTVAIQIARSHTGTPVFWVSLYSGHVLFNMFGSQLELEEIQEIVDSLKLSALCEYEVK